jgi:hypothetical protein
MKDKLKDTFLVILYLGGAFMFFSLIDGNLSDTTIGRIVQTLGAIAGFGIFVFIAYVFIVTIYVSIRDYFRRRIREEARKVIAEEKYLERIRNKEKYHEKN